VAILDSLAAGSSDQSMHMREVVGSGRPLPQSDDVPLRSRVRAGARQRLITPGQTSVMELLAEAPGRPL